VVEMLAKAARTTEEKVEKVFSFIAREAIKGGGKFPEEKKIADYAIEELRIDAEGFANAVNMVKIHLMEVQSKDKERDHPVCAKTCGSLPKKVPEACAGMCGMVRGLGATSQCGESSGRNRPHTRGEH